MSVHGVPGTGFGTYTATGTYSLAASATYWVVVSYLGAPSWEFTNGGVFTGTGTLGAFSNSSNSGANWDGPFAASLQPYLFEVDATTATTAPEPTTVAMMLVGLGGMLTVKRRWTRRSSGRTSAYQAQWVFHSINRGLVYVERP